MSGKYRGEAGAFGQRAIFGPAHRAVVRIGTQQMLSQVRKDALVPRGIDATDIVGDAAGAIIEGGVTKIADQAGNIVLGQGAGIHLASDRQRDQQNRAAEWIFISPSA